MKNYIVAQMILWCLRKQLSGNIEPAIWKGEIIMINKTVKQIMEENKGKEIHLIDGMGTWGELPFTDNNMQHTPDAVEINDNVVKMYIS